MLKELLGISSEAVKKQVQESIRVESVIHEETFELTTETYFNNELISSVTVSLNYLYKLFRNRLREEKLI